MKEDVSEIDMVEVEGLIEIVKCDLPSNVLGCYSLSEFANCLYGKMAGTNSFDSKQLAETLLTQSRRLGISFYVDAPVSHQTLASALGGQIIRLSDGGRAIESNQ